MGNFWKNVNEVIRRSDIILEIIDGRFVEESRNKELEEKVQKAEKVLIYVINKCDLIPQKEMNEWKKKLKPSSYVSAKNHLGTTLLRKKILKFADNKDVIVGVVGYPNVGKSSVINSLKGKASAKTSSFAGYTKGIQKVKVDSKIMILDTPGVIPFQEKDDLKHTLLGSINVSDLKDPELVALKMIGALKEKIAGHYDIEYDKDFDDEEEILEKIAIKYAMVKSGGKPDLYRAAKKLIDDWQTGKIRVREGEIYEDVKDDHRFKM
jgi:ribosome biogenesis GTPase A